MILRKLLRNRSGAGGFAGACTRLRGAGLMSVLLLVACAPVVERPGSLADEATQRAREMELAGHPNWAFSGRLAVSQGKNGGTANITWRQTGPDFEIQLSAPITRQSWRLQQAAGKVRLEGLEGGIREGDDAEAMLLEATGWRVPLSSMTSWIRGARAPGAADLSLDERNLPASIRQDGWTVEYRGWVAGTPALPAKLFARQDDASVRLAIENWDRR